MIKTAILVEEGRRRIRNSSRSFEDDMPAGCRDKNDKEDDEEQENEKRWVKSQGKWANVELVKERQTKCENE